MGKFKKGDKVALKKSTGVKMYFLQYNDDGMCRCLSTRDNEIKDFKEQDLTAWINPVGVIRLK